MNRDTNRKTLVPEKEKLAIDGGIPVRREPLPLEFPGIHYMDEEEINAALRVLRLRCSPFRPRYTTLAEMPTEAGPCLDDRFQLARRPRAGAGRPATRCRPRAQVGPEPEAALFFQFSDQFRGRRRCCRAACDSAFSALVVHLVQPFPSAISSFQGGSTRARKEACRSLALTRITAAELGPERQADIIIKWTGDAVRRITLGTSIRTT